MCGLVRGQERESGREIKAVVLIEIELLMQGWTYKTAFRPWKSAAHKHAQWILQLASSGLSKLPPLLCSWTQTLATLQHLVPQSNLYQITLDSKPSVFPLSQLSLSLPPLLWVHASSARSSYIITHMIPTSLSLSLSYVALALVNTETTSNPFAELR